MRPKRKTNAVIKLTQKRATDLVLAMKTLTASLKKTEAVDAESTRLIEALETALRWGYIAHVAKNGIEKEDEE